MDLVLGLSLSSAAQVVIFTLVPLAFWLSAGRPEDSLRRWLGLIPVKDWKDPILLAVAGLSAVVFTVDALWTRVGVWPILVGGFVPFLALLVVAAGQSLAEEVFFRGFLLRYLGEWVERTVPQEVPYWQAVARRSLANAVQSMICGILRLLAFWIFVDRSGPGCLLALVLGALSAAGAGFVREHTRSLLPSWAAHALGMVLAGVIAMVWA